MTKKHRKTTSRGKKPELPGLILETANFHGGDPKQILQAVDDFSSLDYENLGIKFHAFDPKLVSIPDFRAYEMTQSLFISAADWATIISRSRRQGYQVWLDLFCVYGVETLKENLDSISGIKLQPSVQDNLDILKALERIPVEGIELIINVSGLKLIDIQKRIQQFSEWNFKKIVVQMGFQSFPTRWEDSSLQKISMISSKFPEYELGYSDHLDSESPTSLRFPVYAYLQGCSYLEKHICNQRSRTRYDFQSALEYTEISELAEELKRVHQSMGAGFTSKNETDYYEMTYQKPLLKTPLNKGRLVAESDLMFRRTEKPGLKLEELKKRQSRFRILQKNKDRYTPLLSRDFKKASIAVIVAARMNSTRLPKKAVLEIRGTPSIQRCLQNCRRFPHKDMVILATSWEEEDAVLAGFADSGGAKFWKGDPVDVLARYLGACEQFGLDVVIRVTGDCPVVSPEIAGFLLEAHFDSGADFTRPKKFAIGTNCEIYNTEALRRVAEYVGRAEYSEHMSLYMLNNPEIFKLNEVELPPEWIRNYRLTLDYKEDLEMFEELFRALERDQANPDLVDIFRILDQNPAISKLNKHRTLIYESNRELRHQLDAKTRIKDLDHP